MEINGEKNLNELLKTLKPRHNIGDFVFCVVNDFTGIDANEIIMSFKESEGITVILTREFADSLKLKYSFISAWITLTVHSSLEAVGLTASFSKALSDEGISCNVVAAFYHDHIFVKKSDAGAAIDILNRLSK